MKLKQLLLPMSLCLGLTSVAQTFGMKISLPSSDDYEGMRIFVRSAMESQSKAVEFTRINGTSDYKGDVATAADGVYYVYCQTKTFQTSIPVYVDPAKTEESLNFSINNYRPATSLTDNINNALSAYNDSVISKSITVGEGAKKMSVDEMKALIGSYVTDADAIIAANSLTGNVKDFVRIWAYTSAADAANLVSFFRRRDGIKEPFDQSEILPAPETVIDSPIAAGFPSATTIIVGRLEGNTVEEKLKSLYSTYQNEQLKTQAAESMVRSFINNYNYAKDFDGGVARLEAIVGEYSLSPDFVDSFKARRVTLPGAPFPDVELIDRNGNKVDFSSFRGKYVYVDLWASWCGPCCREVPYLQQLEKEMEGSNVVFVSISTDSSQTPWLKKMDQLNMHGNQLFNSDGKLTKELNISGIPHFMIYDPEGKLHTYKTSRPSHTATKFLLESLK